MPCLGAAALHLGRALHSAQDWWAHGDYGSGNLPIRYSDRHGGPSDFGVYYDVWNYDAATSDGRAPQVFDPATGKEVRYTNWVLGGKRAAGTRRVTKDVIRRFLEYVKSSDGGCKCRQSFLK